MAQCAALICERYSITMTQLRSPFRGRKVVKPRHLCAALCRDTTGHSWQMIRHFLARADNNAIVYACRQARMRYPEELAELRAELERRAGDRPITGTAANGPNIHAPL